MCSARLTQTNCHSRYFYSQGGSGLPPFADASFGADRRVGPPTSLVYRFPVRYGLMNDPAASCGTPFILHRGPIYLRRCLRQT